MLVLLLLVLYLQLLLTDCGSAVCGDFGRVLRHAGHNHDDDDAVVGNDADNTELFLCANDPSQLLSAHAIRSMLFAYAFPSSHLFSEKHI